MCKYMSGAILANGDKNIYEKSCALCDQTLVCTITKH